MFTGIIKTLGSIKKIQVEHDHIMLTIHAPSFFQECNKGDSIAIDGICLTVLEHDADDAMFDVAMETQQKTALKNKGVGDQVNVEKPMSAHTLFDGHIVQGHVDGTGIVRSLKQEEGDWWLTIETTPLIMKYIVEKGSVTINGTSLTVVSCDERTFRIMLLDHTRTHTNLGALQNGDIVNIENDILAKYIEKLTKHNK